MSLSALYRRAAKFLAMREHIHIGMCYAIYKSARSMLPDFAGPVENGAIDILDATFKEDAQAAGYAQHYWGTNWNRFNETEVNECRVLALCFMAAMSDWYELGIEYDENGEPHKVRNTATNLGMTPELALERAGFV